MIKEKFKKFSYKIGFTLTESTVITFLALVFVSGISIKYLLKSENSSAILKTDYSLQDSLFYASDSIKLGKIAEKKVDNEEELLDFSNDEFFYKEKRSNSLKENSINVNKADKNLLKELPGIGEKTAEAIIKYREKHKNFRKIDDLLKVKGIGNSKLNKIRKFIIIE